MFLSNTRVLRAAQKYLRRGKLAAAIARCERVVQRNPRDLTAANALGDLYVLAGKRDAAASMFSTIAEHLYAEGFLRRALAMLRKVIKLEPGSVETLARLAELSERLGRKADAVKWQGLHAAADKDRRQPREGLKIRGRLNQIDLTNDSADVEPPGILEVSAGLNQTQLSEDEFVIKQIFRAEVLAIRGGFDEAVAILREILSFAPDNVPARSKLKDVYLLAGHTDLAANECLQLARIRDARKMDAIGYLEDELEFGLMIDLPSNLEPLSFERDPGIISGFEYFAKPPATLNRRKAARVGMSLPVLVVSDEGGWREFAESVNVSRSGVLLRLAHSVKPAAVLRATMPMPLKMRTSESTKGLYVVSGVVRHALPDPGGDNLVGIEFELQADYPTEPQAMLDCGRTLTSE
ncbi:MAG: tetratricopeptide repeat protein [Blastocatellia bacterium]